MRCSGSRAFLTSQSSSSLSLILEHLEERGLAQLGRISAHLGVVRGSASQSPGEQMSQGPRSAETPRQCELADDALLGQQRSKPGRQHLPFDGPAACAASRAAARTALTQGLTSGAKWEVRTRASRKGLHFQVIPPDGMSVEHATDIPVFEVAVAEGRTATSPPASFSSVQVGG